MSDASDDLTGQAYRAIRTMIVEGGLPPGRRMSHRNLSERLGIGRSPVRDAILQLEAEGLVVQRAQRGVLLRELSAQELAEIFELRLVMEPFLAERAALLATVNQLAEIKRIETEFAAIAAREDLATWFADAENRSRMARLDLQFHITILEAAGNSIVATFFGTAEVLSLTFAWYIGNGATERFLQRIAPTAVEHAAIAHAIRSRDAAGAREAMRRHVADAFLVVPERYAASLQGDPQAAVNRDARLAAGAVR